MRAKVESLYQAAVRLRVISALSSRRTDIMNMEIVSPIVTSGRTCLMCQMKLMRIKMN